MLPYALILVKVISTVYRTIFRYIIASWRKVKGCGEGMFVWSFVSSYMEFVVCRILSSAIVYVTSRHV